jgi:putative ABC transport system permease protein
VAGLVIANTFTVLVAQRTRELALLRCVGALGRQVRRSVLLEAAVVGSAASAAAWRPGSAWRAWSAPSCAAPTLPLALDRVRGPAKGVLIGMVLGFLVTVGAAFARPAAPRASHRWPRCARSTRRPPRSKRGLVRLLFGFLAARARRPGAGTRHPRAQPDDRHARRRGDVPRVVLLGRRGIPPVVALTGRLTTAGSVTRELATLGALRNPQRTAATATALLIGVTLTTAMVVGARPPGSPRPDPRRAVPADVRSRPRRAARCGPHGRPAARRARCGGDGVGPAGHGDDRHHRARRRRPGPRRRPGRRAVRRGGAPARHRRRPKRMAADLGAADGSTLRFATGGTALSLRVRVAKIGDSVTLTSDDLLRLDPKATPAPSG